MFNGKLKLFNLFNRYTGNIENGYNVICSTQITSTDDWIFYSKIERSIDSNTKSQSNFWLSRANMSNSTATYTLNVLENAMLVNCMSIYREHRFDSYLSMLETKMARAFWPNKSDRPKFTSVPLFHLTAPIVFSQSESILHSKRWVAKTKRKRELVRPVPNSSFVYVYI